MIDAIREFFRTRLEAPAEGDDTDALALATAALMFEVSRADAAMDDDERARISELLARQFDLPAADLETISALAEQEVAEATDLFQFTSLVNAHYGQPERIRMIRHLWAVAWADGEIDRLEEHLIRRVADLLHVRHADFIRAKLESRPDA